MSESNEKEKDNKNGKGRGRLFLGLLLVVAAVLMYAYRNGLLSLPTDSKKTDAEYLSEAIVDRLAYLNEQICSEYALAPLERGTAVGEVTIERENAYGIFRLPDMLTIDGESGEKRITAEYAGNSYRIFETGTLTELLNKDFGDIIDISKAGAKRAANTENIKKLLKKYEGIFFTELFEGGIISRDDNFINNLDGVLLVETEMKFEITEADTERALLACIEEARKDKKLKKAYKVVSTGNKTFEEALDLASEKTKSHEYAIFGIDSAKGALYVNVSEGFTMANVTYHMGEETKRPGDKHIMAGFTYLNRQVGFALKYDDGEGNSIDVLGNGTYNSKSGTLNAGGNAGFTGDFLKNGGQTGFSFTIRDLQPVRSGELYFAGSILVESDKGDIASAMLELAAENGLQRIRTYLTYTDGSKGSVSLEVTR